MKDIPVVYEDEDLLVVNKPAGLAVQGGAGISVCLIDVLERQTRRKIYPVHRLDRDTAGLMAVALNPVTAAAYTKYIAGKTVKKGYRALCIGMPPQIKGTITTPAGRAGDLKSAYTEYRVESSVPGFSLLSLELGTGRMHQLRIHLASIGCPIAADDKYGDFTKNREIRGLYKIKKLQLAAWELELPLAGKTLRLEVPLPEHMLSGLAALGMTPPASSAS